MDGQAKRPEGGRQAISAVVVSCNRADIIGTCLRALSFADELVVIDKSSTDGTAEIAVAAADRVIVIPWSPTVEESRAFAVNACTHDWILCLDDDECLSVEAVRFIEDELRAPRADIYALAQRHYILGRHDEDAYYWPEHQVRLFLRGAVSFRPTVHGGTIHLSNRLYRVPPDGGACIRHLSHRDVSQWLEKTNRYTSRPDRLRADDGLPDLPAFARARLDHWLAATRARDVAGYPAAVAILRALYDIIDRLKLWEIEAGLDGAASFRRLCREFEAEYEAALPRRSEPGIIVTAAPADDATLSPAMSGARLEEVVAVLSESVRHIRQAAEQARRDADLAIRRVREQAEEGEAAYARERAEAAERVGQEREAACRVLRQEANATLADARRETAQARQITLNALREQARLRERHTAELAALAARVHAAEADSRVVGGRAAAMDEQAAAARSRAEAAEARAAAAERAAETQVTRARTAEAEAQEAIRAAAAVRAELDGVLRSEFWRLSAPLRFLIRQLRSRSRLSWP